MALAKRLLVAAQACVLVWALAHATTPAAERARTVLIRLSGRLMKRHRSFTEPALLAGLWVLLATLDTLAHHSVEDLRELAASILPTWKEQTREESEVKLTSPGFSAYSSEELCRN